MNPPHWTNYLSRLFGVVADTRFPRFLQRLINRVYVSKMRVDLSDCEPVESYGTLNELFTRKLIKPRQFSDDPDELISPADGLITELGQIREETLLQIKAMEYSVRRLLSEEATRADAVCSGHFINFYLSPSDYHGYHAPTELRVTKLIHIPGKLYPVNLRSTRSRKNLFVENERVVMECEHRTGKALYLVFIGATNVGSMTFRFEPTLQTNASSRRISTYEYKNQWVRKGECLGGFRMGSSIVMISEKNFLELKAAVDQKVRIGDVVAQAKSG